MSETTGILQRAISDHITDIRRLFPPDYQVTVICRSPIDPDGGCMVGNDDPEEVIVEIRRRMDPDGRNEVLPGRKP